MIPNGQLSASLVAVDGTPVPMSIGSDGYMYAIKGGVDGALLCRTNNGFTAVEDGQNMATIDAAIKVRGVTKTTAGYCVVCEVAAGAGAIYFSTSFGSGFTKVLDMTIKPTGMGIFFDVQNDIVLVCEYSGTVNTQHRLYVSTNGGETFATSYTTEIIDEAVASHTHFAIYDPTSGLIFLSVGDGANRKFLVSDDLGATWAEFTDYQSNPKDGATFTDNGAMYQPTLMIPTTRGILLTPDAIFYPVAISLDRKIGSAPWTLSFIKTLYSGATSAAYFAKSPYARNNTEVYFIYPNNATPTRHFIAGTGDGGNTWHLVCDITLTGVASMNYGIVGPDADGYLYAYCKDDGVEYIWKAQKTTWVAR